MAHRQRAGSLNIGGSDLLAVHMLAVTIAQVDPEWTEPRPKSILVRLVVGGLAHRRPQSADELGSQACKP